MVFEEVPAVARFLTAATLVGEYPSKVVDETEKAVPMEHEWPAIYTFGGDDTARFSNDDFRRLELHGLAAEYVLILGGLGILYRIQFFFGYFVSFFLFILRLLLCATLGMPRRHQRPMMGSRVVVSLIPMQSAKSDVPGACLTALLLLKSGITTAWEAARAKIVLLKQFFSRPGVLGSTRVLATCS